MSLCAERATPTERVMDTAITPRAVYFDIEKIATKQRDHEKARMRVYRFKADVAAAIAEYDLTVQLHHQLRRMLVIASKRHRRAEISVFKEAIDALDGKAWGEEWAEF